MSVEILEKGEVSGGGTYLKVMVSDHKALMEYRFDADVLVVMASPSVSVEERDAIKGVCKNKWYSFMEVVKEPTADAGALSSDEDEKGREK